MKKLLLVEDEAHVVSFIKKGLSEEGFEVSVAFDGRTDPQMFQSAHFDLAILDIMLPGVNGLEVYREIRKTDVLTPILFHTALGHTTRHFGLKGVFSLLALGAREPHE